MPKIEIPEEFQQLTDALLNNGNTFHCKTELSALQTILKLAVHYNDIGQYHLKFLTLFSTNCFYSFENALKQLSLQMILITERAQQLLLINGLSVDHVTIANAVEYGHLDIP